MAEKSNIITGLFLFLAGFAVCFYLFIVRVNLGWVPIFQIAHLRQPTAYENNDCLKYNWLVPNSDRESEFDEVIESEFIFCIPKDL